MRLMSLLVIILTLLPEVTSHPNSEWELRREESSPYRTVVVEHYMRIIYRDGKDYGAEHQIWLSDSKNRANRVLLFQHRRYAEVIFSPDQSKLIIANHYFTNRSSIHLFKMKSLLQYEELTDINIHINQTLWVFFEKENGFSTDGFHHSYVDFIKWSSDGSAFLVRLRGYDDLKHFSHGWVCVFDLKTMSASLDLNIMNRNAVEGN
jgi:hypothetical protein